MHIDLARLNNDIDSFIDVNFDYNFSSDELVGTDLLECSAHVKGRINKNSLKEIVLDLNIDGVMIIWMISKNIIFSKILIGQILKIFMIKQ